MSDTSFSNLSTALGRHRGRRGPERRRGPFPSRPVERLRLAARSRGHGRRGPGRRGRDRRGAARRRAPSRPCSWAATRRPTSRCCGSRVPGCRPRALDSRALAGRELWRWRSGRRTARRWWPSAAIAVAGPAWRSMRGGDIAARIELDLKLRRQAEGALVLDAAGHGVGMAVYGPRRRSLVIPAATIERVAPLLETHGRIPRGYLGLGLQPVRVAGDRSKGAMVMSIDPAGPGAAAGVRQGDVIVSLDGQPLAGVDALDAEARARQRRTHRRARPAPRRRGPGPAAHGRGKAAGLIDGSATLVVALRLDDPALGDRVAALLGAVPGLRLAAPGEASDVAIIGSGMPRDPVDPEAEPALTPRETEVLVLSGRRRLQQGDRPPARHLGPHREVPRRPGARQVRRHRPHRRGRSRGPAGRAATLREVDRQGYPQSASNQAHDDRSVLVCVCEQARLMTMADHTTLTVRLTNELEAQLAKLAYYTKREPSFLGSEAVAAYVGRELAIVEAIERGRADVKAGRYVSNRGVSSGRGNHRGGSGLAVTRAVVWTNSALLELLEIHRFIASENPAAATALRQSCALLRLVWATWPQAVPAAQPALTRRSCQDCRTF